jgi:(R)-2-hydroxyglutarate dehydrogenase
MRARPVRAAILKRIAGVIDSPLLSRQLWDGAIREWGAQPATPERQQASLCALERTRSVVLVQDTFPRYFETTVAVAFVELAARLVYTVYVAPYLPNGKPLHVQRFLPAFHRAARRNAAQLAALSNFHVPLVGLDPAMTLVYRQE